MQAKFKILHSRELTTTTPDPNPECITTFGVSGHDIDPTSRFGQKILDFIKLDMVCKSFIDDGAAMDKWYSEQHTN